MKSQFLALLIAMAVAVPARAADVFGVELIRPAPLEKDALYTQTLLWMAENFRSSKDVIDLKDKDLGVIIGNGAFNMNVGLVSFMPAVFMPVTYKVRIDIRDKRYRMTFSDVRLVVNGVGKPIEDTNRQSTEPKVREHFEKLAVSLDEYLAAPKKDF